MKEQIGFAQASVPNVPRTWKTGMFTYKEEIVPGVIFLYDCKYERGDQSTIAPQVQSSSRLNQEEIEGKFADFVAHFRG